MHEVKQLMLHNRAWSAEQIAEDPEHFTRHVADQKPVFLWIGCSDSRVSPDQFTQAQPGGLFIHRNIANLVQHSDPNLMAVIDFAIGVLMIDRIVVCGHYGCGGVKAAMGNDSIGIIDNWIRHIKDVYRLHNDYLDSIDNENDRFNAFVELNVKEQVFDLSKTSIVQAAWKKGQDLTLHGWAYGLNSGYVTDLNVNMSSNKDLDDVYQLKF